MAPQPWHNGPVSLYHGTVHANVKPILSGINLGLCRELTDFGSGFYTTTRLDQAWGWARQKAETSTGARPAVVRFAVDRNDLATLDVLAFMTGHREAEDYWNLVFHCRAGGCNRPDREPPLYDVVAGPVARVWKDWENREIWAGWDQLSFHTARAAALLDRSEKKSYLLGVA